MMRTHCRTVPRQHGMALVTSLLLLLVLTILAVGMFRSFSIEGKIAGNVREKERALHAAESAQQYAEWWLTQGINATTPPTNCTNLLNANAGDGVICSNTLGSTLASGKPGVGSTWPIGLTYDPPSMDPTLITTSAPTRTSYYKLPEFYIQYIGSNSDGDVFQIDAQGYGATSNTVAVVQSTFVVNSGGTCTLIDQCPQ